MCRHGLFQRLSAWADGPSYVTQCPIQPGHKYTYKFNATEQEGTLWWHAHSRWLRATVYGGFIIHPRKGRSYPFPKPHKEFPIIIGIYNLYKLNFIFIFELQLFYIIICICYFFILRIIHLITYYIQLYIEIYIPCLFFFINIFFVNRYMFVHQKKKRIYVLVQLNIIVFSREKRSIQQGVLFLKGKIDDRGLNFGR